MPLILPSSRIPYFTNPTKYHNPNQANTMSNHRKNNPKPIEFDLIHKWDLSEEQRALLDDYTLIKRNASTILSNFHMNVGMYRICLAGQDHQCIPIFRNCSRSELNRVNSWNMYWISVRIFGDKKYAIIQPVIGA